MSAKQRMRETLESGGAVRRDDYPEIKDSTFKTTLQSLRKKETCGKDKEPLTIVLNRETKEYRLWKPETA
jgi:succinate dehydrogenase/fumarate reductase flavoprotein subunit